MWTWDENTADNILLLFFHHNYYTVSTIIHMCEKALVADLFISMCSTTFLFIGSMV